MNQETKLDELNLKEYTQKQKIEQLRRVIFSQKNEDISKAMDRLLKEKEKLVELEKARDNIIITQNDEGLILSAKIEDSKSSSNVVVRGGGKNKSKGEVDIKVYVVMNYLPTAIYHLFETEENPLVTCLITSTSAVKQIKVTSYIEGYSAKSINTIEITEDKTKILRQLPILFPDAINNITELTKATLHVKVEEVGGDLVKEDSYTISLLSRNSAISWKYNPRKQEWQMISEYLGVFITPNQPDIIRFLRKVADFHASKSLIGYQGHAEGDKEFNSGKSAVKKQVEAIFNALKATNIIYTNSVIDFNPHRNFHGQRVRLPKEVLKEQQANCLDGGTFLYASLLEACSLNCAIVLIPGHAFIAWESWEGTGDWSFLETTVTSTYPFEDACMIGERRAKTHFEKESLAIRPINLLRAKGIMPME